MLKKDLSITIVIIVSIFLLGFIIRVDTVNQDIISQDTINPDERLNYMDEDGLPYMYDMDSYYNYRLTRNLLDHGYLGDSKVDDREWDNYSYYPPGVPLDYPPLIAYLTLIAYKIVNLFTSASLLLICFWVPAFIAPLAGVVAYFLVKRYTNYYGAAAAGLLTVTAPFYFMRTVPGFFDTDMFNVLFPLLIAGFLLAAVEKNNLKIKIILASVAAFVMFLFSMAWNGWQYLFYLILLSAFIYILWSKFKKKEVMSLSIIILSFLACFVFFSLVLNGNYNFLKLLFGPVTLFKMTSVQNPWMAWPNVYELVSELQPPSISDLVLGLGPGLLGLGILGIISIFFIEKIRIILERGQIILERDKFINGYSYFFIVFWIIIGFLTLIEGIRFILMLIPPLAVSAGIAFGLGTELSSSLLKNKLSNSASNNCLVRLIPALILILIVLPSVMVIFDNYSNLTPRMNDNMWDAGEWIGMNTPVDTIVVSSWVYGHFFPAIANRPVVFDGRLGYIETLPTRPYDSAFPFGERSPSTMREYWIERAFSTSNEQLSAGIFQMLITSGDLAQLTVDNYTGDTKKSVEILNNILGVSRPVALEILENNYNLTSEKADNILIYTHPSKPKPFVLVTNGKMMNYGYWIFNWGEWNFKEKKGGNYIYSYGEVVEEQNQLKSDDGLVMDLGSRSTLWNNRTPYCVIIKNGDLVEKHHLDNSSSFCVVLLLDENKSVVFDKSFENSLFTQLVILKNRTKYFEPIYSNEDVVVWRTDYHGKS